MSSEEEGIERRGVRSNYFQTEFTVSIKKGREHQGDGSFPGAGGDGDRKKVSISIQTGNRTMVGEESPKERKRWVRPPLVGQASSGSDSQLSIVPVQGDDSEEDEIVESSREPFVSTADYPNRKDYISEKPPEGSSAVVPENRVPSPASASSLTSSRPLEWDSGADVGYFKAYNNGNGADKLSSLELMALGGSASLLTRSDPEGTVSTSAPPPPAFPSSSGNNQTLSHTAIGPPNAESTPNLSTSKTSRSSRASEKVFSHIFPEVVIRENEQPSDSENESRLPPCNVPQPEDIPKRSSSLEDVGSASQQPAPFVRSQSQNNINFDMNAHLLKIVVQPQSNSSSSVATVVKGSAKTQSSEKKESESGSGADGRANSFEYLPGSAFEQVGPNGSDPLRNDIDRGVRILSDFVKGTNANNTLLKKKLLKKVVEELLSKKYPGDEEWSSGSAAGQASGSWLDGNQHPPNASSTWQGLPSVPEGGDKAVKSWPASSWPLELGNERCVTRRGNGMEPERSELSGESESQASLLARMGKAGKPSGTSGSSASTSSVAESSIKQHTQPLPGFRKRASEPNHIGKEKSEPSSSTSPSDWKAPATKSEMIYEQRKQKGELKGVDPGILRYLNCERENQLDWIKKEIDHLSNLKRLLEMHESLRKNFDHLKKSKAERKERAQSADPKVARQKKRPAHISKSEPLKPSVPKEEISDNGWESHDYGLKVRGVLRKNASTNTLAPDKESQGTTTKRPISYTILFEPKDKENVRVPFAERPAVSNYSSKSAGVTIADRDTLVKESRERIYAQFGSNLQEELMRKKPDYVARAEMRRQTVAEWAAIREIREKNKTKILAAAINGEPAPPIPNPLARKRIVSQKCMRKLTEKNYRKSSHIKQQQNERKRREERVTNRLMAEMFNRNLQRRILKGETYLSNSINVL